MPIKVLARVLGCSKNTVKATLTNGKFAEVFAGPSVSSADEVERRIGELRAANPTMPATVIAERIGWKRSIRTWPDRVAQLRPVYLPPDPASRTSYVVAEIGQHDFRFPDIQLPVGYGQVPTATSSIANGKVWMVTTPILWTAGGTVDDL
jgi:transposase